MASLTFTRLALATALCALAIGNPAPAGAQQSTFKSGVDMVPP